MLQFHQKILETVRGRKDSLTITGRGMDIFLVIEELCIEASVEKKWIFVIGLDEGEKRRIVWDAANRGVEFLPRDVEKEVGKKERSQLLEQNGVFFVNANLLAKDFLTGNLDSPKAEGIIVVRAEKIHTDPGLQLAISLYKSKNPSGYVRAFTERCYFVTDLAKTARLLWVDYILLYPRFESTVKDSLKDYDLQIIDIGFNKKIDDARFEPIITREFSQAFYRLRAIITSLLNEASPSLKLTFVDAVSLPRRILEARVKTNQDQIVMESLLFLRRAYSLLLHDDPIIYSQFVTSNLPTVLNQPLWYSLPQAQPFIRSANVLASNEIPVPKLQWVAHLISELKEETILILAEGSNTVSLIANYLSLLAPLRASSVVQMVENGDDPYVDPETFGILNEHLVHLYEIHAQVDVFEVVDPSVVIFWDSTLLAIRRFEMFCSRSNHEVAGYLLAYADACELDFMQKTAESENQQFIQCIHEVQSLVLLPMKPLTLGDRIIVADEREFRSALPLALLQAGFNVIPETLIVGDYVLSDEIVIERKSFTDLVGSLKSGRLLQQIQRMHQYYKRPMLLLEFSDEFPMNSVCMVGKSSNIMAKLWTIVRSFPNFRIIWGADATECGRALFEISKGCPQPDVATAVELGRGDRVEDDSKATAFLRAIPFLTTKHIELITRRCKNLPELALLTREDMIATVGGIVGSRLFSLLHSQLS